METASGFGMWAGPTSSLNMESQSGPYLCKPFGYCHSLCEFICILVLLCLEGLLFLVFSILLGPYKLYSFYLFIYRIPLGVRGRDSLDRLGLSVPMSPTLYTLFNCDCIYLSWTEEGTFFDDD